MKVNRSLTLIVLLVVVAMCIGILLSGCASMGKGKDAGPEAESSGQTGKQSAAAQQTSGISPEVRKEPVAYKGGSERQEYGQGAGITAEKDGFKHYAASVKQALDRILPEKLTELNWNRIGTVLVGLLVLSMIYGLGFALGRLPARKKGAVRRSGAPQTMEHAGGSVPQ
jgi:uncharacterized protein YceK